MLRFSSACSTNINIILYTWNIHGIYYIHYIQYYIHGNLTQRKYYKTHWIVKQCYCSELLNSTLLCNIPLSLSIPQKIYVVLTGFKHISFRICNLCISTFIWIHNFTPAANTRYHKAYKQQLKLFRSLSYNNCSDNQAHEIGTLNYHLHKARLIYLEL